MPQPILDTELVREALDAIRKSIPLPQSHPLHQFFLVSNQNEHLGGEYATLNAIANLLRSILLDGLHERSGHDEADLEADFQLRNVYQEGYSVLYYFFLRPELNWSMEQMAIIASAHRRTLKRREATGIQQLTVDLIQRETHLRQQQRRALMQTRIPYPAHTELYNRAGMVDKVLQQIAETPVLLAGAPRMGKTTIASVITHRRLDATDDLYWIDVQPDTDVNAQIIAAMISPIVEDKINALYAVLSDRTVMLVLENVEETHLVGLDVKILRLACVLLTCNTVPINWNFAVFAIPPLDTASAHQFIINHQLGLKAEEAQAALTFSAGNPGLLLEFARLKRFYPDGALMEATELYEYYASAWRITNRPQRLLWSLIGLAGRSGLSLPHLKALFQFNAEDLLTLLRSNVLILQEGDGFQFYSLSLGAQAFFNAHVSDLPFENIIYDALTKATFDAVTVGAWLRIMKNPILINQFWEQLFNLLLAFASFIPHYNLWVAWEAVVRIWKERLSRSPYHYLWCQLQEARIERWRGILVTARDNLRYVISQAGELGFFDLYAYSLLELSYIALYQELWHAGAKAAEDAEQSFRNANLMEASMLAALNRAQALAHIDPDAAITFCEAYAQDSLLCSAVLSEAFLAQGDTARSVKYAFQVLDLLESPDGVNQGRALLQLGRALREDGQQWEAVHYMIQCVNQMADSSDMIGLARVHNNLGVLYHDMQRYEEAQEQWQIALNLFLRLQDRIGLQTVRHNIAQSDSARLL